MTKVSEKVSKRYAKALFELCKIDELDSMKQQLMSAAELWSSQDLLRKVITNPAYSVTERSAAFQEVAERVGVTDFRMKNMFGILIENNRLGSIQNIADIFSSMIDVLRKALALKVTSAYAVSNQEIEGLKSALLKEYSGMASVEWGIDPQILGGLKIQAGDKLLDNSLKTSLEKVRTELLS